MAQAYSTHAVRPGRAPAVHVVDPDPLVCETLCLVLGIDGYRTAFSIDVLQVAELLRHDPPDVMVTAVRLGNVATCELVFRAMKSVGVVIPTVALVEPTDAEGVLLAQAAGASQVVLKPFTIETLTGAIDRAVKAAAPALPNLPAMSSLTPRELEVLKEITDGRTNQQSGRDLGISPRTVEVHRRRIMEKLGARNTVDLMQIVLTGRTGRGRTYPRLQASSEQKPTQKRSLDG
jgi:FixJ family two-component response regulator